MYYSSFNSHWFEMTSCFFGNAVRFNKFFINFIYAFFLTDKKNPTSVFKFAFIIQKVFHIISILGGVAVVMERGRGDGELGA